MATNARMGTSATRKKAALSESFHQSSRDCRGRLENAFRKTEHEGKALAGPEAGHFRFVRLRAHPLRRYRCLRAEDAGERLVAQILGANLDRKVDAHLRLEDGPVPLRSRHVPVELVVRFEPVDGALDAVCDHVRLLSRHRPVGVSDSDEDAPIFGPGRVSKRPPLAIDDAEDPQPDRVPRAHGEPGHGFRSRVAHGNGSEDAVLLLVEEIDLDGLGHEERAVRVEEDGNVELIDLARTRAYGRDQKSREEKRDSRHVQSRTLTASRSEASAWKKERVWKPRKPARRFEGKTSCLVLKSRTTAL